MNEADKKISLSMKALLYDEKQDEEEDSENVEE